MMLVRFTHMCGLGHSHGEEPRQMRRKNWIEGFTGYDTRGVVRGVKPAQVSLL